MVLKISGADSLESQASAPLHRTLTARRSGLQTLLFSTCTRMLLLLRKNVDAFVARRHSQVW